MHAISKTFTGDFRSKKKELRKIFGLGYCKTNPNWYKITGVKFWSEGFIEPMYGYDKVEKVACCVPVAEATAPAATKPWGVKTPCLENILLDDFQRAKQACLANSPPIVMQEKQKDTKDMTMYAPGLETEQRNYLKRRLESVNSSKEHELLEKFGQNYTETIKTLADAEDALKRMVIRKKKFDAEGNAVYGYNNSAKDFFDIEPKVKPDNDGFRAASVLLGNAFTDAKDAIMVAPLADAAKALKDFEAKSIQ